jgi:hypothetical protein
MCCVVTLTWVLLLLCDIHTCARLVASSSSTAMT